MIVELERFLAESRPRWERLEAFLDRWEKSGGLDWASERPAEELAEAYALYRQAVADLARLRASVHSPVWQSYLEDLVGRAFGEIHEHRERTRLRLGRLLGRAFPQAFRRHWRAFALCVALTVVGAAFGAGALAVDEGAKGVIMPFGHLLGDPSQRVAQEEAAALDHGEGMKASFSAMLMTHNTRVGLFALGLGMTFGLGTGILLFYNGVILGAVAFDYLRAGEGVFLTGWLLPHGSVEIPAILIAGQAGFLLAGALLGIGSASGSRVRQRLREVTADVVALAAGMAMLLVWAGVVESYLSQSHEPVIPYPAKIAFGLVQFGLLTVFLARAGRGSDDGR